MTLSNLFHNLYEGRTAEGMQVSVLTAETGDTFTLQLTLSHRSEWSPLAIHCFLLGSNLPKQLSEEGARIRLDHKGITTSFLLEGTGSFTRCFRLLMQGIFSPTHMHPDLVQQAVAQYSLNLICADETPLHNTLWQLRRKLSPEPLPFPDPITKIPGQDALLREVRNLFVPDNLTLTVVGNIDPRAVLQLIPSPGTGKRKAAAPQKKQRDTRHQSPLTPEATADDCGLVGIYLPADGLLPNRATALLLAILSLQVLCGPASLLQEQLFDADLLEGHAQRFVIPDTGGLFCAIGGKTENPNGLTDALLREALRLSGNPVADEELDRLNAALPGCFVMHNDHPAALCRTLTALRLLQISPADLQQCLSDITPEMVSTFLGDFAAAARDSRDG